MSAGFFQRDNSLLIASICFGPDRVLAGRHQQWELGGAGLGLGGGKWGLVSGDNVAREIRRGGALNH